MWTERGISFHGSVNVLWVYIYMCVCMLVHVCVHLPSTSTQSIPILCTVVIGARCCTVDHETESVRGKTSMISLMTSKKQK